ncbi:MAG: hypothetical protein COB22_02285 [Cycloclasticus sp.]|nr:MAG: hypothetical protein COB22_02285 [Cycloclasticus sp.]
MNKLNFYSRTSVFLVFVCSTASVAVDALPIDFAGMNFTPTLMLSESYDDNVWNAPTINANGERSSWVTKISPEFVLTAQDRLNVYQLSYRVTREEVHSSSGDSHTDHNAAVTAHLEFNARNRLDLKTSYEDVKARRDSENNIFRESGNESESYNVGGVYGYGANTAKGQIEIKANRGSLRYNNNVSTGSMTRESERDVTELGTTLYYRIAPKTRVLAEVQHRDYDYKSSTSLLDGDSTIYRLGVAWDATAKTSGAIRIGREKKEFDASGLSSVSNPSWDATITWQPRTYSAFTLSTSSLVEEGSATENHIKRESTKLSWDHRWNNRLSSNAYYSFTNQEYTGSTNDSREDDISNFSIGVNYQFRRWMDVGLQYQYLDNDSNDPASDYDKNIIGVMVTLSL